MRPSKADTFMKMAFDMAEQSTCASKHKVGAIIVNQDWRILASGFNGAPRGMIHCDDPIPGINCALDNYGRCTRAIHAEVNALLQCASYGIPCKDAFMFCTFAPCMACAKLILQAGIKELWYAGHPTSSNGLELLVGRVYLHKVVKDIESTLGYMDPAVVRYLTKDPNAGFVFHWPTDPEVPNGL
jgi:dCMP deaminase